MKITTIIPTYRRSGMLKRAIESVLAQSYSNIEICIYDNASDDDTEYVVREYAKSDARIKYHKNATNLGPVLNMIQGVRRVESECYSLLNDDDFLLPGFYEQAIEALQKHPEAMLACAKTKVVNVSTRSIESRNQDWQAGMYQPSTDVLQKMYRSHFVPTSVLFKRDVRDVLGPFETSGNDSLYLTMAAASLPFVVLDHYGGAVILHEQAYSMIGEGINKEPAFKLYEHFLSSVASVMSAPLSSERKTLLLMLVINSYHQIFDSKRLSFLLNGGNELEGVQLLEFPSLITNRGLVAKVYRASPNVGKPLLKVLYWAVNYFNKKRSSLDVSENPKLSEKAFAMLSENQSDYSDLYKLIAQD